MLQGPVRIATPLQLQANKVNNAVTLTWLNVGTAAHVRIYRGLTPGNETLLTDIATSSTSFVDTNVVPGQTDYYQTAFVSADGEIGPRSNEAAMSIFVAAG